MDLVQDVRSNFECETLRLIVLVKDLDYKRRTEGDPNSLTNKGTTLESDYV